MTLIRSKARRLSYLLFILLFSMILVSCQAGAISDPFFPQQRDAHPDRSRQTFLTGKLILINNCLRVRDNDNNSYLLIWPQGFSLNRKENPIQVYDDGGHVVARVGDVANVEGGEIIPEYVANVVMQPLPADCARPYWVVGEVVK